LRRWPLLGWLSFGVILAVMVGLIFIGQYLVAIPLLIPLLERLDALGFYGEKEDKVAMEKKLSEVFSPIHSLVLLIEAQLETDADRPVEIEQKRFDEVNEIIDHHSYDFDDDLILEWHEFADKARQRYDIGKYPIRYSFTVTEFERVMLGDLDYCFRSLFRKLKK
jgi:hypothetical protein